MDYRKQSELRRKTLDIGREWIVVSVPGDDDRGDATHWFAMHRHSRKSSPAFNTYDEALLEAQKRNGLR
jgi:hypothetical protein